ncbi:hypothetical protein, partial [Bacillus paralicheniformis]|uniref:hypothetical protein n=1 Tax=Bacillus paralicheniformis TaxID=1648923 RepID=UPI001C96309E
ERSECWIREYRRAGLTTNARVCRHAERPAKSGPFYVVREAERLLKDRQKAGLFVFRFFCSEVHN